MPPSLAPSNATPSGSSDDRPRGLSPSGHEAEHRRHPRALLDGLTPDALTTHRPTRAAFERFLEILSEASRHVPDDWKAAAAPELPWRRVADLGNHIRHAYHRIDAEILWNIYEVELDALERAVDAMLARFTPDGEGTGTR